ncbi:MAG: efflux RND transporter periplasmic adaptor subunit [Aminipila sp.]
MMVNIKEKLKCINKKRIIVIGIVIAIAVFAGTKLLGGKEEGLQQPVSAFPLEKMDITESISSSGKIESRDSENVSAITDGKIKKVYVKVGQQVKRGDILAQLETSNLQREIEKANQTSKTEINAALQDMQNKNREYDNAKFLYEMGELSQDEMIKSKSAYEMSSADYEAKKAAVNISNLQQQIADATIKAPISGTITWVNAVEGNTSNGIMFTIENIENLKLVANVSEYDVNNIKLGQKSIVKTEMTGELELSGEVLSISPTAQKDNTTGKTQTTGKVQFPIEISINDKNPMVKIGANARVNIITAGKNNVLAVPFDSLVKDKNETSVYIADKKGNKYIVKKIDVKTGIENDIYAEVISENLKEGMLVLNNPKDLTVGQEVQLGEQ